MWNVTIKAFPMQTDYWGEKQVETGTGKLVPVKKTVYLEIKLTETRIEIRLSSETNKVCVAEKITITMVKEVEAVNRLGRNAKPNKNIGWTLT